MNIISSKLTFADDQVIIAEMKLAYRGVSMNCMKNIYLIALLLYPKVLGVNKMYGL